MQRIYLNFPLNPIQKAFELRSSDFPDLYHQMTRVLRMQVGESCIFFGEATEKGKTLPDTDFVYEIKHIDKKSIAFELVEILPKKSEPELEIVLFQALPNKREKLEYIIQKWVEVGISEFVFFPSERSQKAEWGLEKKKLRFEEIAKEAVEQCGANHIPVIRFVKNIEECLIALSTNESIFVTHTDGQGKGFAETCKLATDKIALFVGPEGGFSPLEVEKFKGKKAVFLDLGSRILRTETAGVVTAFALRWGKTKSF